MAAVDTGPGKPARISVKRPRGPHRGGREMGDVYISMNSSKNAFADSVASQKGEKTIERRPSTQRNGGTRQSRQNVGRQGAI